MLTIKVVYLTLCFDTVSFYFRLKRPDTAGTQFRSSLNKLMVILMSKEPAYVRCIKPNDSKMPSKPKRQFLVAEMIYFSKNKMFFHEKWCYLLLLRMSVTQPPKSQKWKKRVAIFAFAKIVHLNFYL